MVGKYGDIIFETNDKRVLAFNSFTRKVSGRWGSHAVIGRKEKLEFNGPGGGEVSFKMVLCATLGVRPRRMLEKLEEMAENGMTDYLVIGGKAVGENRFAITNISETWDAVYSKGDLAKASVTVTLKEYC